MKPVSMIINDVKLILEREHLAEIFGLDTSDLANALHRKLHDDGVTDTVKLMRWIDDFLGLAGICAVLNNLQLEIDPNDSKETLLNRWFSYRGVDELPQPHVRPDELAENLTEMARQVAATPASFDALRLMEAPLTSLLRYTSLFYGSELRRNGRLALSEEGDRQLAGMLENLTLSSLCDLLKCDAPLRAKPYDPTSKKMIMLTDATVRTSLSRLADLAGAGFAWSSDQSREFSDCLLAVLEAWHGHDPYTPKACTVAGILETGFESRLTCYDEMGSTVILNGVGSSPRYGSDVLVRTADEGEVWAPEPQVVPKADAWETPETASRNSRNVRIIKLPRRDQVFISYSHADSKWLRELQMHLEPYVRNATVEVWDDTKIKAGAVWREAITQALGSAKVAILLVSPAFLASKFIAEEELPPLLSAAKSDGVTILWVPVRTSSFEVTPIEAYQAAHPPGSPLASLPLAARDKAWVEICKQIQQEYQR